MSKSSLSIGESQALFDNMHLSKGQTSEKIIIKTGKNFQDRMKILRVICDKIYENSKGGGKRLLRFQEENCDYCINCVVWRVYGLFNWRLKLQWRDKTKNKIAEYILTSVWKR